MKRAYIFTLIVSILTLSSCTNNNDDYPQDRGATIGFTSAALEVTLPPGGVIPNFGIPFFVTSISSSDRTFEVTVVESESTLSADNYSFESTVTVPANERKGTLLFNATNNSISPDEFQNLVIAFVSTGEISSGKTALVSLRSTE